MKKIIELIKSLFNEGLFASKSLTIKSLEKETKSVVNVSKDKKQATKKKKK